MKEKLHINSSDIDIKVILTTIPGILLNTDETKLKILKEIIKTQRLKRSSYIKKMIPAI